MSYSTLYKISTDGDLESDLELRNGSGFAPQVWGHLVHRYRRQLRPEETFRPLYNDIHKDWQTLFDRWEKCSLRQWENRVLLFTYDNALIRRASFRDLADAIDRFHDAHWVPENVSHCGRMSSWLRERSLDESVLGAGYHCTSVTPSPWYVHCGEEDEYGDREIRQYNINVDSAHWWADEHERWTLTGEETR